MSFRAGDALLLVDCQNDFCPGGALPIEGGDKILPFLNRKIEEALQARIPIYASRDWHPPGHVSFKEQGGVWPVHCVRETAGAQFHPDLKLPREVVVVSKGMRTDQDNYSAFDGTGLADLLRSSGMRRLWVGGLAQDVCVRATVLDGLKEGFEVHLFLGGTRPVTAKGGAQALKEMEQAGALLEKE